MSATDEEQPETEATSETGKKKVRGDDGELTVRVRRMHRRDLNRVWEFLKMCFRDVNRDTVEYQRPRSKRQFLEVYDEEGIEQLLFETGAGEMVGYAECAVEIVGSDNWINERYFDKRDMRPLFVEELAVHPGYHGRGIGSFVLEQLEHLARVRGCTHLVLEVAENNQRALRFYRGRTFYKLDAAIFMAKKINNDPELLPPRAMKNPRSDGAADEAAAEGAAVSDGESAVAASEKRESKRPRARKPRGA